VALNYGYTSRILCSVSGIRQCILAVKFEADRGVPYEWQSKVHSNVKCQSRWPAIEANVNLPLEKSASAHQSTWQQVTGHNNHSDVVGEESAVPGEPSDFPDIPKSSRITLSTCAFSFSLATF